MIVPVLDKLELISAYELLREVPTPADSLDSILSAYLAGKYEGVYGVDENGLVVGVCLYQVFKDMIVVILLWARKATKKYVEEFVAYLKEKHAVKRIRFLSVHDERLWRRLFPQVQTLWSVYEVNLEEYNA